MLRDSAAAMKVVCCGRHGGFSAPEAAANDALSGSDSACDPRRLALPTAKQPGATYSPLSPMKAHKSATRQA